MKQVNEVIEELKGLDVDIPEWDIALAALAQEEYEKYGHNLRIADFQRLAAEHAIRFDDIMVTIFELCIHGEWLYQDVDGKDRTISRDEVEKLYVGGRLADKDVAEYKGSWRPFGH